MLPTQQELLARGYPLRPDPIRAPDDYAAWLKIVSIPYGIVAPKIVQESDEFAGIAENANTWCGVTINYPGFLF